MSVRMAEGLLTGSPGRPHTSTLKGIQLLFFISGDRAPVLTGSAADVAERRWRRWLSVVY